MEDSSVTQKVYDLLKEVIPMINRLPRTYKFTLGDRLQIQLLDLLEIYVEAFFSQKSKKTILLNEANIKLEVLRHYFRLGFDMGLYTSNRYQYYAQKLQEIGRMTGGWLKALKK